MVPSKAPPRTQAGGSSQPGMPACTAIMAPTAVSDTVPPTDRSMPAPPASTTSACPSATKARMVENCRIVVTV